MFTSSHCKCYTTTTSDEGCWIFVCAECTSLGMRQLAQRRVAEERELQLELEEIAPVRPLDVSGIPANGTEAYYGS